MELPTDSTLLIVADGNCCDPVSSHGPCDVCFSGRSQSDSAPIAVECRSSTDQNLVKSCNMRNEDNCSYNQVAHVELNPSENQVSQDLCQLAQSTKQVAENDQIPGEGIEVAQESDSAADPHYSYYREIYDYITKRNFPGKISVSHKMLLKKRAKNFCVKNGILYYGMKRVIMGRKKQLDILKKKHIEERSGVHLGVKKMSCLINSEYFWKGQYFDVTNYVRQCKTCTEIIEPVTAQEPIQSCVLAEPLKHDIWQKVEVNVHGPFTDQGEECVYIITMVDPVSHFAVAKLLRNENFVMELASFILESLCMYGFAKCYLGKTCRQYAEPVKQFFQDKCSSMEKMLNTLNLSTRPSLQCSILVLSDEIEGQYEWVHTLLDQFVNSNMPLSESNLFFYIFKVNSQPQVESPFFKMFGRAAYSNSEDNKENTDINILSNKKDVHGTFQRRQLRSSTLQCRHCAEVFTSKISFRIHQRKHTEEARRRGMLEGQAIRFLADRERRALRRPVLKPKHLHRKQRDSQDIDEDSNTSVSGHNVPNTSSQSSSSIRDLQKEEDNVLPPRNSNSNGSLETKQVCVHSATERSTCITLSSSDVVSNSAVDNYTVEECVQTVESNISTDGDLRVVYENREDTTDCQLGKVFTERNIRCSEEENVMDASENRSEYETVLTDNFKCDICGMEFCQRTVLVDHLKTTHLLTQKLHYCEVCKASFLSVTGLRMHIQSVHEPLKNYACSSCNYVGKCTNSLSIHISRNHKKKYKCTTCDYASIFKGGLEKHLRLVHSLEERSFLCQYCQYYRGATRRQLLNHEKTVHTSETSRHSCPVCKKLFKTRVQMKHHVLTHTNHHFYGCKGCQYTTRFRQSLYYHIKHSHPGQNVKDLSIGPSDADFQALLKAISQGSVEEEQCATEDFHSLGTKKGFSEETDVPESSEMLLENKSVPSVHETPSCSYRTEVTDSGHSTVVSGSYSINPSGASNQTVTIIDGSGLTENDLCRIVAVSHDFMTEKREALPVNLSVIHGSVSPPHNIMILPLPSTNFSFFPSHSDMDAIQPTINNDIVCHSSYSYIAPPQRTDSCDHENQ